MLLPIHVVAGCLAIIVGAAALLSRKGGTIHRKAGMLFVYSMAVMGITAAIIGKAAGGLVSVYFVVTALTTVRPVTRWTRAIDVVALTFAVGRTFVLILGGVIAFNSPSGRIDDVPYPMIFFLAAVMIAAVIGDVRVMRFGVRGAPRLARHLWRMCFALFIATASFFSIRERVAKILPEPFTSMPMRMLPILLVFVAMFYWLWRVRGRSVRTQEAM